MKKKLRHCFIYVTHLMNNEQVIQQIQHSKPIQAAAKATGAMIIKGQEKFEDFKQILEEEKLKQQMEEEMKFREQREEEEAARKQREKKRSR